MHDNAHACRDAACEEAVIGGSLTVQNEVPRPAVVSVLCGMDTREERCGHVGRKVFSESLFSFPCPNKQAEKYSFGRQSHNEKTGLKPGHAAAPPQKYSIKASPFYRRVLFHGDVLQARNLPAMDADALVNPWWTIEVEDKVSDYEAGRL